MASFARRFVLFSFLVLLSILAHTNSFAQSYDLSQLEGVWRGQTTASISAQQGKSLFQHTYDNENYRISVAGDELFISIESSKSGAFHAGYNYQNTGTLFRVKFVYFDLMGTYYQRYGNKYGCNPAKDLGASGEVSEDFKTITLKFSSTWAAPWSKTFDAPITGCEYPNHMSSKITMRKLG